MVYSVFTAYSLSSRKERKEYWKFTLRAKLTRVREWANRDEQAQPGLATDTAFDGRPYHECIFNVCAWRVCVRVCNTPCTFASPSFLLPFPLAIPLASFLLSLRVSSRFVARMSCGSLAERMVFFTTHWPGLTRRAVPNNKTAGTTDPLYTYINAYARARARACVCVHIHTHARTNACTSIILRQTRSALQPNINVPDASYTYTHTDAYTWQW